MFQSERAKGIGKLFSAHWLILHILLLLTPVGLAAAVVALLPGSDAGDSVSDRRRRLFVRVFTGVPLVAFFWLSLFGAPKFHWTGPVWLALLPTMAWMLGQADGPRAIAGRLRSIWKPTIAICVFLYAFGLHYVVLGIPGIPYKGFNDHYYWREATREVEQIAAEVERETGQKPIVVGMSKWSVASALSFYERKEEPMDIRSRNFFGLSGAMYDFWHPSDPPTDRPIILVSMKAHLLEHNGEGFSLDPMLVELGPIEQREIMRDGKLLREIYYRIAHGYKGIHLPASKENRDEDDRG